MKRRKISGFAYGALLLVVAALLVFALVSYQADATISQVNPEYRWQKVVQCKSDGTDIDSTNTMTVAANASGYSDSFRLATAESNELSFYLSASNVNSGTHTFYLQGSMDDVLFTNLDDGVDPLTLGTASNQTIYTTQSVAAAVDTCVRLYGFAKCPYYRVHVDADASHAIIMDEMMVSSY